MRPFHSTFLMLAAGLLVVALSSKSSAQPGKAKLTPAEKAYREAMVFQLGDKITQARDKMKDAVRLAPKSAEYREYLSELESLVQQEAIDKHAVQTPADAEVDIETLAKHLMKVAHSDRDKARVVFRWVADRIAYDFEGLTKRGIDAIGAEQKPDVVLKSRKAVCSGYCDTYTALAKAVGLEVVTVGGYLKTPNFVPSGKPDRSMSHGWNAVKIKGEWVLLDVTKAAGGIQFEGGVGKFNKNFDGRWFIVPPEIMAITHFPHDAKWQLGADKAPTEEAFWKIPYFDATLLFSGFKYPELAKRIEATPPEPLVDIFTTPGNPKIVFQDIPLDKKLKAGQTYKIRFTARCFTDFAVINGGDNKWQYLTRKGGVFEGSFKPKAGTLQVSGMLAGEDGKYRAILGYVVE